MTSIACICKVWAPSDKADVFHAYGLIAVVHVPPSIEIACAATEVTASKTVYTTDTLPFTTFAPGNEPSTKVMLAIGAVLSTTLVLFVE